MKTQFWFTTLFLLAFVTSCEVKQSATEMAKLEGPTIVEAACGQCQFGLKGEKGCTLAIRYEGKSCFVDGFKIDDLGDAHARDGLCYAVRKGKVTGEFVDGHFTASSFELFPTKTP
jgi:hypothetical protein